MTMRSSDATYLRREILPILERVAALTPDAMTALDQLSERIDHDEPGPPARPPKPIRFTLDLDSADHKFLKGFALTAEVDASRVMRALLDELRRDDDLARRVCDTVWRTTPPLHGAVPQPAR